ncbi:MAG: chemotaxis protein MotC [Mesorhizobium sp.]|nr:chemotaxis protein MotC [Mesorhizobium sp.]
MRATGLRSVAGAALATLAAALPGRAAETLQPYQMVRSLQLVQDRIASGDQAALPMQAKLLELVDARLRKVTKDELAEPKNLRALLVYGMSGGNPATVKAAAAKTAMDTAMQAVATGVVAYLTGNPADAVKALQPVDPMTLSPDLGAFVALVKGSLLATDDPVQALALLDKARLLSPGTLVEEAALRRSVGIAAATGDAARFSRASTQYVEHYLHSPYASQFADAFVSGVIAMHAAISQDRLTDITSMMDAEREKVIYLRIARRAAIDGLNDLSAFASARAEDGSGSVKESDDDPRALLYASLSAMTSATIDDLRENLKRIDRNRLSQGDRALFDAAEAITHEIAAPPGPVAMSTPPLASAQSGPVPAAQAEKPKSEGESAGGVSSEPAIAAQPQPDMPALTNAGADLPPVEGEVSERPAVQAAQPPPPPAAAADAAIAAGPATAGPAKAEAMASGGGKSAEAADATIADARRKLEQIDKMLGASPQ